MALDISGDTKRFKDKLERLVKQNLGKYIRRDEFTVPQGEKIIRIPSPKIEIPRFVFGNKGESGVGQGEGEIGDILDLGNQKPDRMTQGDPDTPYIPTDKREYLDIPIEKMADILIEQLRLPKLKPSENKNSPDEKLKWNAISETGPRGLTHKRRTLLRGIRRSSSMGLPAGELIIDNRDRKYKSWRVKSIPDHSATIVYLMDVSPSMGDVEKSIAYSESFWTSTILKRLYQNALGKGYKGIKERWVVHADFAEEVSRDDFFSLQLGGSTKIWRGYEKVRSIVEEERQKGVKNVYVFHYTDGDIYGEDEEAIVPSLEPLVKEINVFMFTQIRNQEHSNGVVMYGPHGPHEGLKGTLEYKFEGEIANGDMVLTYIKKDDGNQILASIKNKLRKEHSLTF